MRAPHLAWLLLPVAAIAAWLAVPSREREAPPDLAVLGAAIQEALDRAPEGFVLTAGDSHAALLGRTPGPCGPAVTGAIGGARSAEYLQVLEALAFPRRPRVAILSIGAAHLLVRADPGRPGHVAAFEAQSAAIVARLATVADRVVVLDIAPVGQRVARKFDGSQRATYVAALRSACAAVPACAFADPYAALRGPSPAVVWPGLMPDDLHFADYGPVWRALAPTACGAARPG